MNELMNRKGVCRTAPATPCLFKSTMKYDGLAYPYYLFVLLLSAWFGLNFYSGYARLKAVL